MVDRQNKNDSQSRRFKEAARQLSCNNNEEAADELMRRVASSPPPRKDEKSKRVRGDGEPEKAKPTKAKSR
jgi:hypothetical protein